MSFLQSFPSESRDGEGRMLSEKMMRWSRGETGLENVQCLHVQYNHSPIQCTGQKNTRVKRVQACKAFLTFLPVFPPSREAFVCAKSAAGSPTCDDTSADVQKSCLCCSSALMLMDFVHILDKQDALNHQKSH